MIKRVYVGNIILIALTAIGLASCGFHLRGNIPLPENIQNMHVKAPKGTFKDQLEDVLENGGAQLSTNEAGADVVLDVVNTESRRTVGTLDERGKANSYNFILQVDYELLDPQGNIIREASLTESRRYDFDPELIIESESEELELLEDMEQDIALRVVRQLSSLVDYSPSVEAGAQTGK
jgi:LPS-assembly lipoprotein